MYKNFFNILIILKQIGKAWETHSLPFLLFFYKFYKQPLTPPPRFKTYEANGQITSTKIPKLTSKI